MSFLHSINKGAARSTESSCDCQAVIMSKNEHTQGIDKLTWRSAFGQLLQPAFRLHQYRSVHTRMLRDALRDLDRDC